MSSSTSWREHDRNQSEDDALDGAVQLLHQRDCGFGVVPVRERFGAAFDETHEQKHDQNAGASDREIPAVGARSPSSCNERRESGGRITAT